MRFQLALLALWPLPALAECPPAPDVSAAQAEMYQRLNDAPSFAATRPLTEQLWKLWTRAPDRRAQDMLDAGMRARDSFDFDRAMAAFDALTAYCPNYAEGFNQRAFVHFLRENHAAAIADLEMALSLNPDHVAALAGLGLTLHRMGRPEAAQDILRRALRLNPWLPERGLVPDAPPVPKSPL